ncbi:FkbM family methyltransferase [Thalassoglobus sp. JC818]|uniref:FkbM family methyltransferase n=1 Tax=Thalassoglobus sp. JC818 TaxID=3232136 RepID=UPI00345B486D
MNYEARIDASFKQLNEVRIELEDELQSATGPERGHLQQLLWNCKRQAFNPLYLSQAGQDSFIDQSLMKQKEGGVFVDVGGYDGYTGSNSFFFETFRNWSGILIEPVCSYFHIAQRIRKCECLNVCVSDNEGEELFIHVVDGYTQMSGLADTYSQSVLKLVRDHPEHKEKVIQVPTRSLESILRERDLFHIDCLFVDVEGAEGSLLTQFPFDDFQIDVCCIENNLGDAEIPKLMAQSGYECVEFLGADEVYVATGRVTEIL